MRTLAGVASPCRFPRAKFVQGRHEEEAPHQRSAFRVPPSCVVIHPLGSLRRGLCHPTLQMRKPRPKEAGQDQD